MKQKSRSLTRFAWLSIAAALLTIALKTFAYFLTDSVGLLSDAMESLINLASAVMALSMLMIASRPADDDHAFGHSKAEYFSSGVEGILIFVAAVFIGIASLERFFNPRPIDQISLGLVISGIASMVNLATAIVLSRAGKRYHSITLQADSKHLMTDVWTSAGVIVGIGLVSMTGWLWLDPLVAMLVALNILFAGFSIIRQSIAGLMDKALPIEDIRTIQKAFVPYELNGIQFHALQTRRAASRNFVSFHVLVPGQWSVQQGHELLEEIEAELRNVLPNVYVSTHLEPLEDPLSYKDITLDRN